MVFTEEYFQGEERDGFYVQPLMKRVWAAQLEVLQGIDAVCKRYHIKYFAMWGTLLGAVRHHGYIPWDDDMDLGMLRGDYEKFLQYIQRELPKEWQILKVDPTLTRIENSDRIRTDQEFLNRYHGCPYIVGIDVYCMDAVPFNKEEEEVYVELFWAVCNLYKHWELFLDEGDWAEKRWEQLQEIEALTGFHFDWQTEVKEQLYMLADCIAAMYWDTDYKEVTSVSYLHNRSDYRIQRACFEKIIEMPFENMMIPIPKDYDPLLRVLYGKKYMMPVMGGSSHEYPFFKDQIEKLRRCFVKQGLSLPEFFDM